MPQVRFPGESRETQRARALRTRVDDLRDARQRILSAADEERRRIERDLHDGAQQRLVAVTLTLRLAQSRIATDPAGAAELVAQAREEAQLAIQELRELARGIHPALLNDRGLAAALEALATRAPVPVQISGVPADRLCQRVEACAYFVTAEALTNVAKYANATEAFVDLSLEDHCLRLRFATTAWAARTRRPEAASAVSATASTHSTVTSSSTHPPAEEPPSPSRSRSSPTSPEAAIEWTGGRFVATSNQLVPASPDRRRFPRSRRSRARGRCSRRASRTPREGP